MLSGPRLVVRPRATLGGWLVRGAWVLVLMAAGALLYEIGSRYLPLERLIIGRDAIRASELAELRRRNDSLRAHIQVLETSRDMDHEAFRLVEESLGELQEELQRREQELQFYRTIVAPEDGLPGLRIQHFRILEQPDDRYMLRLVLVQAFNQEQRVTGALGIRFRGRLGGEPVEFTLADLVPENQSPVEAFAFRYFQELGQELELPEGFAVDGIDVEVAPSGGSHDLLREAFDWQASLQREGAG